MSETVVKIARMYNLQLSGISSFVSHNDAILRRRKSNEVYRHFEIEFILLYKKEVLINTHIFESHFRPPRLAWAGNLN